MYSAAASDSTSVHNSQSKPPNGEVKKDAEDEDTEQDYSGIDRIKSTIPFHSVVSASWGNDGSGVELSLKGSIGVHVSDPEVDN